MVVMSLMKQPGYFQGVRNPNGQANLTIGRVDGLLSIVAASDRGFLEGFDTFVALSSSSGPFSRRRFLLVPKFWPNVGISCRILFSGVPNWPR